MKTSTNRQSRATASAVVAFATLLFTTAPATTQESWQQRIEADWLLAEEVAAQGSVPEPLTTKSDAKGGCDGIKNGEWGFHTGESNNPWWQVDLGEPREIGRVVIWNRREAPERAAQIIVLLSDDGKEFRQVYQHDGKVFGGKSDGKPLVVELKGAGGRFVRLALSGTSVFHLDEVEVFGVSDPQKNLALNQPADQVSISQWSVTHTQPTEVDWTECTKRTLAVCERLIAESGAFPLTPALSPGERENRPPAVGRSVTGDRSDDSR